jgi:hypothetical protein
MRIRETLLAFGVLIGLLMQPAMMQPAMAGGPVVVEEETIEVVADDTAQNKSGWIVPVVVGLIVLCALACGGEDGKAPPTCKSSDCG